jgi:hypothetical protein
MRRPLLILAAVMMASLAIAGLSSVIARSLCARQLVPPGDDLAWFRREFRLSEAELQHIRQLHEDYLPRCREICARIADKKQELQDALADGQGITPIAEQKLAEIAALRVECQTQMLRHFREVSQAMPPEQGRRYLEEMQRLTLGFHEQIEHSMAPASLPHGHH